MISSSLRPAVNAALVRPAIIAGLIGGVVVDAFLSIVLHRSPVAIWQFVASTIVGQGAYTSPAFAILGFVVHFITSIVWAVLYAYVFASIGQLKNWIAGAIVWGVVVNAAMQALLAIKIGQPFGPAFLQGLIPHIVFFALPVALYMANAVRGELRRA